MSGCGRKTGASESTWEGVGDSCVLGTALYFVEGSDPRGPQKAPEETSAWTPRAEASFPEAPQRWGRWLSGNHAARTVSPLSHPVPLQDPVTPPVGDWLFLAFSPLLPFQGHRKALRCEAQPGRNFRCRPRHLSKGSFPSAGGGQLRAGGWRAWSEVTWPWGLQDLCTPPPLLPSPLLLLLTAAAFSFLPTPPPPAPSPCPLLPFSHLPLTS